MASKLFKEIIEVNKCVKLWGKMCPWFLFNDGILISPRVCKDTTFSVINLVNGKDDFINFIEDNVMAINPDLLGKINTKNKVGEIGDFIKFNNNKRLAVEVKGQPEYIGVLDNSIESLNETKDKVIEKFKWFNENKTGEYQLTFNEVDELVSGEEMEFNIDGNIIILNKLLIPCVNKKSGIHIDIVDNGVETFEVRISVMRAYVTTHFYFKALKL